MITLALDTSTTRGSVALLRDATVMAEASFQRQRGNDEMFDAIAAVTRTVAVSEIGLFAVGLGPGSFTGIRAGIAAVRGLALPLDRPIKGVSSFDVLALTALPQMPPEARVMCVIADAGRGEVYSRLYGRDGRPLRECRISARENVADEPVWVIGAELTPSAAILGRLAQERFLADGGRGDERLEPIYLRATEYRRCASSTETPSTDMFAP